MKKSSVILAALTAIIISVPQLYAGEKYPLTVKPSASVVSSYIWRGLYQSGAAFQPGMNLSVAGFSLGVWGSTDFNGQGSKEFDINASYSIKGFTVSLSDLWWAGESGIKNSNVSGLNRYFNYKKGETSHFLEAGLSYVLPVEKFPLQLSWYTIFYGPDINVRPDDSQRQAYTSYFELAYPFKVASVDMTASVGCSPWTSQTCYLNKGFAVTNVSLKAQKAIVETDKFSLPLFVQAVWNPDRQDVHCVSGLFFTM